jgi:PAS domain S-box-containing protein
LVVVLNDECCVARCRNQCFVSAVKDQFNVRQLQLTDLANASDLTSAVAPVALSTAALRDSERRLRQMTEGSNDQLILVDRELCVLFANRSAAALTSVHLIGKPIDVALPPRSRDRALACMQRVLQQGAMDRFELEWSANGVPRVLEVRVAPVTEDGQVVALTLNGSDTTDHVLAQRAIATQAKMIESMLEGVALINEAGIIVITNPAFDALFGHVRGMLIGQSLAALAGGTPLDRGMLSALTGNEGGPWPLEFNAHRKDGGVVTVAGALSRLDDAGRTHLLLVLQDVSERKLLESAILEAVNREQYRIGNDLHDGLGQELTGIALMLRCLSGRLAVEHRSAVPDVESITRLVSNAVESTRSLARGLSPVNLERGGLRDALAGLAMHARSVYGIKVLFTNRLPTTLVLDDEVANHMYRIAQEAITNAVKHGHAKTVRLHLSAVHGKVRLVIADDGCGMPADVSAAPGLGLRIMRYRARIAHGDVRIERAEPCGTRVLCECAIGARALQNHAALRPQRKPTESKRTEQRIAAKHIGAILIHHGAKVAVKQASTPLVPLRRKASSKKTRSKGEYK